MVMRCRGASGLRAVSAAVAALLTVALGCAPAQAAETVQLKAGFSPYRLGHSTTLKLGLEIGATGSTSDGLPSSLTSFDISMPPNLELITSTLGLAVCQPTTLMADGADGCSANARMGYGSAKIVIPVGSEPVSEATGIEVEMGPPVGEETGVLLYAEGDSPLSVQLLFPGVLVDANTQGISTMVPPITTWPGAANVSTVSMDLSLGPERLTYYKRVRDRTVSYHPRGIALPAKCPRGGFTFGATLTFADGSTVTAANTVRCPAGRR